VPNGTIGNAVAAVAEIVEYHGHGLAVRARTENGVVLHVKTTARVLAGSVITLAVPAERVLVFTGHDHFGGLTNDDQH
jgi:putative spermidine/putrescine transport system ATP-binding protein